jgi:hypothetical protein
VCIAAEMGDGNAPAAENIRYIRMTGDAARAARFDLLRNP